MTEQEQPKPCPFCPCDNPKARKSEPDERRSEWFVLCWACGAHGPEATTRKESVRLWNLAPRLMSQADELTTTLRDIADRMKPLEAEYGKLLNDRFWELLL